MSARDFAPDEDNRLNWVLAYGLDAWRGFARRMQEVERRFRNPGHKRLDDRKALYGNMFVLYTGIPREFPPQEMSYGSGMTCWRRLREWTEAGVWPRLRKLLLAKLNAAGLIDWSRAAVDGSHVRALKGGAARGRP